MRITTTPIALLALPALTTAVSLIDFVPRLTDVSGGCGKVYEQKIPDCSETDFTQKSCTESCVRGLQSMTKLVKDACAHEDSFDTQSEENVLSMFLMDKGPGSLCANAAAILSEPASSSQAPTPKEHVSPSSTHSSTHGSSTPEPATTSVASSTATASSGPVPTSLAVDTSSLPEKVSSSTSASATEISEAPAETTTSTESSQIYEAPSMPATWSSAAPSSQQTEGGGHSGGGSPFDAAGAEFSAAASTSSSAFKLLVAVIFTTLMAAW